MANHFVSIKNISPKVVCVNLHYSDNIPERTHLKGDVYFDLVSEVSALLHWSQCFWTMYSVAGLWFTVLFTSWRSGSERKRQKRARIPISPSREYSQRFNFLLWNLAFWGLTKPLAIAFRTHVSQPEWNIFCIKYHGVRSENCFCASLHVYCVLDSRQAPIFF